MVAEHAFLAVDEASHFVFSNALLHTAASALVKQAIQDQVVLGALKSSGAKKILWICLVGDFAQTVWSKSCYVACCRRWWKAVALEPAKKPKKPQKKKVWQTEDGWCRDPCQVVGKQAAPSGKALVARPEPKAEYKKNEWTVVSLKATQVSGSWALAIGMLSLLFWWCCQCFEKVRYRWWNLQSCAFVQWRARGCFRNSLERQSLLSLGPHSWGHKDGHTCWSWWLLATADGPLSRYVQLRSAGVVAPQPKDMKQEAAAVAVKGTCVVNVKIFKRYLEPAEWEVANNPRRSFSARGSPRSVKKYPTKAQPNFKGLARILSQNLPSVFPVSISRLLWLAIVTWSPYPVKLRAPTQPWLFGPGWRRPAILLAESIWLMPLSPHSASPRDWNPTGPAAGENRSRNFSYPPELTHTLHVSHSVGNFSTIGC